MFTAPSVNILFMTNPVVEAVEREISLRGGTDWLYKRFQEMGVDLYPQKWDKWKERGIPKKNLPHISKLFAWDLIQLTEGRITPATQTDEFMAPYFNVRASMGKGFPAPDYEEIVNEISISRRWISENLTVSSLSNLALLTAYGDSMKPTFNDGDVVIVDRGITDINMDAVFVLERENELYIKRIQRRLDGSIRIISDNKEYDDYDITRKDLGLISVLGRVLSAWTSKKL